MNESRYRIERGVEMPPARAAKLSYPFLDMAPGDSFLVECTEEDRDRTGSRVSSAARAFVLAQGNGSKLKFATRRLPEGIRCWRVK